MRRLLALLLLSTIYYLPPSILATDYQQCETSSTCVIGEFLYNDDYSPLTGASCTLTAKNPDGTPFVTAASMTGRSDGWYSYDASIPATTGLYSSTICCTPASGLMCLDKSFEVKVPVVSGATAADIWSYSGRTLTSYGSLVNDIWSASSRSLTSFGSLVSDVWSYTGRTMTSFGNLVENIWGAAPANLAGSTPAPSTLQNIITEQTKQRELLEKLVNAPIITLSLEDKDSPDLSKKLEDSKKQASAVYDLVQSTKSRLLTLDGKWSKLSASSLEKELTEIAAVWTDPMALASLTTAWNNPLIKSLNTDSVAVKTSLSSLLASATLSKSSTAPSQLFTTIESLTKIEDTLGDVTSVSGDLTFYGFLAEVLERDTLLDNEGKKIALVLEDWDTQGEAGLARRVKDSQSKLLAINEFPGGQDIIKPATGIAAATGKAALKNLVFSLQGLIGLNRSQLASAANSPIRGIWLEEGSIVFRAVITNPSEIVTQSAGLKFLLPKELKDEDIMYIDPDLTATYDTVAESLSVTGTFSLQPGATKIVAVEVEDIWQLTSDELLALKTKASDLLAPLSGTNLLSQGAILKSSIDSDVDGLLRSQNKNIKPENRIRSYREAQLALANTKGNLTQLENLVAQAGSNNSFIGFVGGVSTTAVFGIILVIVAGFVFLSTYFKKLALVPAVSSKDPEATPEPILETVQNLKIIESLPRLSRLDIPESRPTPSWQMPALIAAVVVVTATGTVALTQLAKPKSSPAPIAQITTSSPIASPVATPSDELEVDQKSKIPEDRNTESPDNQNTGILNATHTLTVPQDSTVNIRNKPSSTADIIMPIKETVGIYVFKESGEWRQIGFTEKDITKGYWVNVKFIEQKN